MPGMLAVLALTALVFVPWRWRDRRAPGALRPPRRRRRRSAASTFSGSAVSRRVGGAAATGRAIAGRPRVAPIAPLPDTIVDSGPSGPTNDTTPTFTFHSTVAGSSFACSIDAGVPAFAPCSGPGGAQTPAAPLGDGAYTFRVGASDARGADPSPATRTFVVDTVHAVSRRHRARGRRNYERQSPDPLRVRWRCGGRLVLNLGRPVHGRNGVGGSGAGPVGDGLERQLVRAAFDSAPRRHPTPRRTSPTRPETPASASLGPSRSTPRRRRPRSPVPPMAGSRSTRFPSPSPLTWSTRPSNAARTGRPMKRVRRPSKSTPRRRALTLSRSERSTDPESSIPHPRRRTGARSSPSTISAKRSKQTRRSVPTTRPSTR